MKYLYAIYFIAVMLPVQFAESRENELIRNIYDEELNKVGRYSYSYPAGSASAIRETTSEKYSGIYALEIMLDFKDFSGTAIGIFPPVSLDERRFSGTLEFWIKGSDGEEKILVILIDSDATGERKTETFVKLAKYIKMDRQWQKVMISVSDFPDIGQYWNGERMIHHPVDWSRITEVKFAVEPYYNPAVIKFYVDDIKFVKASGLL